MFVHLNKKISVPNCSKVRAIAWSSDHDFIACGGDNGILKVIKLEENFNAPELKNSKKESSKNLSLNQTLEGHKSTVQSVCWNEPFQKLTSSDSTGSIIVWMLYKNMWYEEMVNSRNKSLVSGMAWTVDGHKICIAYDDGAIITGSVDGNRIWGKEIKGSTLTKVEWSPDGKVILIGTSEMEIQVFDNMGNLIKKIPLSTMKSAYTKADSLQDTSNLIEIKWFKHYQIERALLIAFDDGRIHLMKNENDDSPLVLNTEMTTTSVNWNPFGDMFAVTGKMDMPEGSNKSYLKLYNNNGDMMQMIKLPGNEVFDCSWEKTGLRLALAVDSSILFASVKPNYDWGHLNQSIVIASKNHKSKCMNLTFCDLLSNVQCTRSVKNFCKMATWTNCCAVVTKLDRTNSTLDDKQFDLHSLTLFNSNGTLIDYHLVNMQIKHCCLNSSRMVAASEDSFYIWNFNQLYNYSVINNMYTDNKLSELTLENDGMETIKQQSPILISHDDPISCITASEKYLVVGHESGVINQFLFPNAIHVHKIENNCFPYRLALNKNSSRLSLIDKTAKFFIYDFDVSNEDTASEGNWLDLKLNDIWDMKWAIDNTELITVLEKNKVSIINVSQLEREEPVTTNGYILSFDQLIVTTIRLDAFIAQAEYNSSLNVSQYLNTIESQHIRELKEIVNSSLVDAANYCLQFPSFPCLWKIISDESLRQLNLETTSLAMAKFKDYKGLQFVKKLKRLKDDQMRKAEITAYFGDFDEAENIYLKLDRADLAINLNSTLGNYEKIVDLLKKHNVPNHQKEVEKAHYNLAMHYCDNNDWKKAIEHFEKIDSSDQLVRCYINTENFEGLIKLIDRVSSPKLQLDIAMFLESMGLSKESVKAYVKANKIEMAINVCVMMCEWKLAIDLANEYKIPRIDTLLDKYVQHLIKENKFVETVEVYRKANKIADATSMITRLINEMSKSNRKDALTLKKLFVLIGLLYEDNRSKNNEASKNALNELLDADDMFNADYSQMTVDPWKGAEAYHFYLLSQRHMYQGYWDLAMKAALHLQNYKEFLSTEQIYSLIALTSYSNKCFDVCSKAFIKLEAIGDRESESNVWTKISENCNEQFWQESVKHQNRIRYEELAVSIFLSNPPSENKQDLVVKIDCKFCGTKIPDYSVDCYKCHTKFLSCVASGKPIMDPRQQWACKQCGHNAIKTEISSYSNCPLCHYKI